MAQELVDGTIAVMAKYLESHPDGFNTAVPVVARNFGYLAKNFAYRIKDAAFSEEREWRLIYARDPQGPIPAAERSFRSGARGLIPYVPDPDGRCGRVG
jgi:hypothetical protein